MPGTVKSGLLPDADRSHKCDCQDKGCWWMRHLLLDKGHFITVLLYAAGGAVFYAASHVMTARFGFIQRQKTLDNVGKIAIMIAVLLVFATGFWQMGFPLTAEEFVVLATGHSFWIITDFKELKNNFSMFLEKTFLVITVIILAGRTLFYLLFPDAPEIYVLAACAGIGLGIARSIYTN